MAIFNYNAWHTLALECHFFLRKVFAAKSKIFARKENQCIRFRPRCSNNIHHLAVFHLAACYTNRNDKENDKAFSFQQKLLSTFVNYFTITAEIHARSLINFYFQYAERHINLKFMRHVSELEREIRLFVIVKNKLMSVFNASVLSLTMNFVITLSKQSPDPLGYRLVIHSYLDNVMTKFVINNRTDA